MDRLAETAKSLAMARVYEENCGLILGMAWKCRWMSKYDNSIDVDDLRQEAFLAAVCARETYRGPEDEWPKYLGRAIYHKLCKAARRRHKLLDASISLNAPKAWNTSKGDDDGDEILTRFRDDGPLPEECLEKAEEMRELAAALKALPDAEREAVTLYYLRGYKMDEVAERLGIGEKKCARTLREGLADLRKAMGGDAEPDPSGRRAGVRRRPC